MKKTGLSAEQRKAEEEALEKQLKTGPLVFASVRREPMRPIGAMLAMQFGVQIVSVAIACLLLPLTSISGYGARIRLFTLAGLLIGIAGHVPNLVWYGFPTPYTLLEMADLFIGWTLAGAVVAKIVR